MKFRGELTDLVTNNKFINKAKINGKGFGVFVNEKTDKIVD